MRATWFLVPQLSVAFLLEEKQSYINELKEPPTLISIDAKESPTLSADGAMESAMKSAKDVQAMSPATVPMAFVETVRATESVVAQQQEMKKAACINAIDMSQQFREQWLNILEDLELDETEKSPVREKLDEQVDILYESRLKAVRRLQESGSGQGSDASQSNWQEGIAAADGAMEKAMGQKRIKQLQERSVRRAAIATTQSWRRYWLYSLELAGMDPDDKASVRKSLNDQVDNLYKEMVGQGFEALQARTGTMDTKLEEANAAMSRLFNSPASGSFLEVEPQTKKSVPNGADHQSTTILTEQHPDSSVGRNSLRGSVATHVSEGGRSV